MSSPSTSPVRPSKFIEGSELTRPELLALTPTSNELFFTILSEMDEFESKHKRGSHRGSQSSVSSTTSSHSHSHSHSASFTSSPTSPIQTVDRSHTVKEGRRSINFGRKSLDDDKREAHSEEKLASKFKGRLRALTGGKDRDVKPYSGT
jgi:hypothetical protein